MVHSALTRPGRFDNHITITMPDIRARHKILQLHTKKITLDKCECTGHCGCIGHCECTGHCECIGHCECVGHCECIGHTGHCQGFI